MPQRWLILGSGGHGRSVADAIRAQGDVVLGFLEDSSPAGELVAGVPVLGPLRRSRRHGRQVTPLAADFSVLSAGLPCC